MAVKWSRLPYTPDLVLFETGVGCVSLDPPNIASKLGMSCDSGLDELDHFQVLVLERDGERIGFLRHRGTPRLEFSTVCDLGGGAGNGIEERLASVLPELAQSFVRYSERW
jgi:hypothetical protein